MSSALLLAAGKATRLLDIRDQFAKACVPISGTSPLEFLIRRLHFHGVRELWINLHWQKEQVQARAQLHAPSGMQLHFLEENSLLGTGGTLLRCKQMRGEIPDLVLNAKMFTDLDFSQLLASPPGTLALHPKSNLREFGGLKYDDQRNVTGLFPLAEARALASEKTFSTAGIQAAVYTGIARPHPEWMRHLEDCMADQSQAPHCLLRHGVFPAMAAGVPCKAFFHAGWWCEISTPERIQEAEALLNSMEQKHPLGFD
jgi:NDP-sugar pyrophosphorylase family protein